MAQIMKQPTQNTYNFILMQSKKLDNKLGFQSMEWREFPRRKEMHEGNE